MLVYPDAEGGRDAGLIATFLPDKKAFGSIATVTPSRLFVSLAASRLKAHGSTTHSLPFGAVLPGR